MKYSEEEKKAIERVKKLLENASPFTMPPSMYFSLETILNLISKQQKEIENSISKDKIRKKIEEILIINRHKKKKDSEVEYAIDILKELEEE